MYWVQQLVIERKIPASFYSDSPVHVRTALGDVKMLIQKVEKAMVYVRRWAVMQGWKMDFNMIETRYYHKRPNNHPCRLLEPYIIEIPTALPPEEYPDDNWGSGC